MNRAHDDHVGSDFPTPLFAKGKELLALLPITTYASSANFLGYMVRSPRIELGTPAWKAGVLPLNYDRLARDLKEGAS